MTSLTRKLWGREFTLSVYFEDLDDTGASEAQWDAYGRILSSWQVINDALPDLKEYCLKVDGQIVDNVFTCVIPKYLFVADEDAKRVVALMCDYRYDPEHGIAIVFENEVLSEIGMQDIVL